VKIGLDLDNTLLRYDRLFLTLAAEQGWLPAGCHDKTSLRDVLRAEGGEDRWQALQALAYGPALHRAEWAPGLDDFLTQARAKGADLVIVSHKSRFAAADCAQDCDLHAAARQRLASHPGLAALPAWFEPTRPAKLARIAACGCTDFVDDLPEILRDPAFPAPCRGWWLHPQGYTDFAALRHALFA